MYISVPPNNQILFLYNHYNELNADHAYLNNHASTLKEASWDQCDWKMVCRALKKFMNRQPKFHSLNTAIEGNSGQC